MTDTYTVLGLETSPLRTRVIDSDGMAWNLVEPQRWVCEYAGPRDCTAAQLLDRHGPITEEPSPTAAERAAERNHMLRPKLDDVEAEQPMPTKDSRSVPVMGIAHDFLDQRRARGLATYGTELHSHNGRNAVQDAVEEVSDALIYLAQVEVERVALWEELQQVMVLLRDVNGPAYETLGKIIHRYFPEAGRP